MPRNLPAGALAAMMAPETSEAFIYLLTLTVTAGTLRYTNNSVGVSSNLDGSIAQENFLAIPFALILAPNEEGKVTGAQLTFDNVDRQLIDDIRSQTDPIPAQVDIVSSSDTNLVVATFRDTVVRNVGYNELSITGTLATENLLAENFSKLMTGADYPALFITR